MKKLIINRNETLYGPSPKVRRVIKSFQFSHAALYIDGYYNSILIPRLSREFNLPEEQIIISYGVEDFFRTICDRLNPQVDSILTSQLYYYYYDEYLKFKKIKLHLFKMAEKENEFIFDIDDCIKRCQLVKPVILLIASPNNPTGNSISSSDLDRILRAVSHKSLVVIDEAYFGFDKNYNQEQFLSLVKKYPSLIILRSFSKLYALAGLRIGFALCGKEVKKILNYENRYLGMSRILEEAAIAALESNRYYKKISDIIIKDREWLVNNVGNLRYFKPFNSNANFILIKLDEKVISPAERELEKERVLISKFVDRNLLRVSIEPTEYVKKFFKVIEKIDKEGCRSG